MKGSKSAAILILLLIIFTVLLELLVSDKISYLFLIGAIGMAYFILRFLIKSKEPKA
jgi:hypothetical protein